MNSRSTISTFFVVSLLLACSASGASTSDAWLFGDGGPSDDDGGTDTSKDAGDGGKGALKCTTSCGEGQVCSEGKCVDLPSTCPCPVESYCDLSKGACKVGCTRDEECSAGRFCDEGKRTCKDGCRTEKDCAKVGNGTVTCEGGACVTACLAKFHACGAACKGDTDPSACGVSCTACPTRANATASCTSGACKSACNAGFHECGASCSDDTSAATCGTSCTPCPGTANGNATCDGTSCGIKCDAGYVLSGSSCVEDCATKGCGAFEYCDSSTHLCKAGCERHDECTLAQFCKISTHTCEATTAGSFCPAGFKSIGTCSDGHSLCVNASLPSATKYVFSAACPLGTTARGSVVCSGPTYVCVPNDP